MFVCTFSELRSYVSPSACVDSVVPPNIHFSNPGMPLSMNDEMRNWKSKVLERCVLTVASFNNRYSAIYKDCLLEAALST